MRTLKNIGAFVVREFLGILPPMLFFLVAWTIISLTTSLVLSAYKLPPLNVVSILIIGATVGKVVAVMDAMPFMRRLDRLPLAYPVLFRAAVYAVLAMLARLAEAWLPPLFKTGSLAAATAHMLEEIPPPFVLAGQIWIFVLFLLYFAFALLFRQLGLQKREILTLFFTRTPTRDVA